MTEIKYIYENKEYNNILQKIISKNVNVNDINKYYLNINLQKKDKNKIVDFLTGLDNSTIHSKKNILEKLDYLKKDLQKDFCKYILNYLIGYRELTLLIDDDNLEEIMINNYNEIFVITRKNEHYKTDVSFTEKNYELLLKKIKKTISKDFIDRDFIDGILPDNSRINIVSKNISKFNLITIRKFLKRPLTIVDLINNKTINYEVAAYLWIVIDGLKIKPANLFVCGGTSTGKTTFLNILLHFISKDNRVIGIEDTREIDISMFENNVSLVSNIADPDSLYNITINILRMRPDRIIIGETRGKEAKALFMAMDTGHQGCLSTIHANNSVDLVDKLVSSPMNIETVYIKLLNVIITVNKKIIDGKIYRYVSEITEIKRIGNITFNNVYLNDNVESESKVNFMSSHFLEEICDKLNISKNKLKEIIENRIRTLRLIVEKNITDIKEIREILLENNREIF